MKKSFISAGLLIVSFSSFARYEGYSTLIKSPHNTGIALSKLLPYGTKVGDCLVLFSRFISEDEYQLVIANLDTSIYNNKSKTVDFRIINPTEFSTNSKGIIVDSLNNFSDSMSNYSNKLNITFKGSLTGAVKITGLSSSMYIHNNGPYEIDLIKDESIECGY